MDAATGTTPTSEALAGIGLLLDAVDHEARRRGSDVERLHLLRDAVQVAGRCTALAQQLAAEVVASEAAEHAHGTSPAGWLTDTTRLTRREACGLLFAGRDLQPFHAVRDATLQGAVLPQQARAITRVLHDLPEHLPATTLRDAEELMVAYAGQFTSSELAALSRHLLEALAPDIADASEAERLEREYQSSPSGIGSCSSPLTGTAALICAAVCPPWTPNSRPGWSTRTPPNRNAPWKPSTRTSRSPPAANAAPTG